ncbi:carboxylesterase family protein [Vibrio echinoideorum]|uniref:carboxylesterase family protein n=1 Tax=Vibrio echinoideorum TaxID=2100116 RepID=UPI0010808DC3|nr:carboxylesterase family protein [Vibrio echinoideorum]
MTIAYRSMIALTIAAALAGCDTDTAPTVPLPDKPEPLVPAPAKPFDAQIGDVTIKATKEELVLTSNTKDDKLASVETFKGIRFADAERFEHSTPVELTELLNSEGIVDATSFGDACPQLKTVSQTQSEDCLNLNIWRPVGVDTDADLPVYVFVHGGDFEYGSGAEPLIQGDTVVAQGADEGNPFIYVTFNYRLGLLGSMWVDDEKGGNFGIGDQKRALQWVNKNISKFGGNAEDVTLMGQGSGAMSVGVLQQDNVVDSIVNVNGDMKYFNRAIMQSNPYGFEYKSNATAQNSSVSVCEALETTDTKTQLNALKVALEALLALDILPEDIQNVLESIADDLPYLATITVCADDSIDQQQNLTLDKILEAQRDTLLSPVNKVLNWVESSVLGVINDDSNTPMSNLMPFAPYIDRNGTNQGLHLTNQPVFESFSVPTVIGNNEKDANTMSTLPALTFLIPTILELLQEDIDNGTFESLSEGNKGLELAVWLQVDDNQQRVIDMVSTLSLDEVQTQIELGDLLDLLPSTAYEAVAKLFFGLGNADFNNDVLGLSDYAPWSENELGGATKNMSQFKTLMNDMLFQAPARNQAIRSSEDMNTPVSMYHFAYKPSFNVWTYNTQGEDGDLDIGDLLKTFACISGACGGSELPFIFNKPYKLDGSEVSLSSKDQALMNDMSRLWFSDNLFTDYEYSQQQDNVLFVDGDGQITIEDNWDVRFNESEDDSMLNGRLQGLNDLGLTLKYMSDYEIPNQD